jgi:hypothetical protein
MNKRQKKKIDKNLINAIRELNNDIAISDGFPFITDEEVFEVLKVVKESKDSIKRTLKDYKRFIVND